MKEARQPKGGTGGTGVPPVQGERIIQRKDRVVS
jgi:hypothetical protein